jgi:hypothetical protein
MHLVIPFAAPSAESAHQALAALELPHLQRLLAAMERELVVHGDEWSLTPPHEAVLAGALGWPAVDGGLPWAAQRRDELGLGLDAAPWALVTPVHWHLGTEQLTMLDPASLRLDPAVSRQLFDAVAPLFTSEGFVAQYGGVLEWFVSHASLADLPTASLDRVIGRNVDRWLPATPEARLVRRLQNEVQMLLHEHPLNAEREQRGLLPVNSVWISGCGVRRAPAGAWPAIDPRLRGPALAGDWAAWAKSWSLLDADLAKLPLRRLTLCGERAALALVAPRRGLWRRLAGRWRAPAVRACLEAL